MKTPYDATNLDTLTSEEAQWLIDFNPEYETDIMCSLIHCVCYRDDEEPAKAFLKKWLPQIKEKFPELFI